MPTLQFLLYLLVLGLVFLFRASYIGWFGPFLLYAALLIPPMLTLLSLPSMLRLRVSAEVPATVTRGKSGELQLRFETRSLLPVRMVSVRVEFEDRYTGERVKAQASYRMLTSSSAPIHAARAAIFLPRMPVSRFR